MKSAVRVSALVLLATAWATLAGAQVTSAVIQGVVRDAQGGVVPGVVVKATNAGTGLSREVPSDEAGLYRITALPPGTYDVAASLDGFAPFARAGVVLTVGQTAAIDVTLGLAGLAEAVTVDAEPPLMNPSSNALGTTVTRAQLDELPLAGRDFASLARLAPGVTSVGSGGISTGGQLTRNNSVDSGRHDQRRTGCRRHPRQLLAWKQSASTSSTPTSSRPSSDKPPARW